MKRGSFIISLDFELFWGVQDVLAVDDYRSEVLGVESVVKSMLALFSEHSIHATWASVGFLFAENLNELKVFLPPKELWPTYDNEIRSSYRCLEWLERDEELGKLFFASDVIKAIGATNFQEIATHTLSHYYCEEAGQTVEQFNTDLVSAKHIARELHGLDMKTLVFPRNQSDHKYVQKLRANGMIAFRGEEDDWIHSKIKKTRLKRAFRLLDSYIPLTGSGCYTPHKTAQGLVNLKGSRFLRPYSKKLAVFEKLKLRRIKKQMLHAARKDLVFHLWWHPHNFGVRQEYHMAFLKQILEYYQSLSKKYGMRSLNMLEAAREYDESQ